MSGFDTRFVRNNYIDRYIYILDRQIQYYNILFPILEFQNNNYQA